MKTGKKKMSKTRILLDDRIKQADAARILKCSRQRIKQRIKKGSLIHDEIEDVLGNKTVFVSLKQVEELAKQAENLANKKDHQ